MSSTFCPRCGAAPARQPCPSCGYTSGGRALESLRGGLAAFRAAPVRTLVTWLPVPAAIAVVQSTLTPLTEAAFPLNAVAGSIIVVAVFAAAFGAMGLCARRVVERSGSVGAVLTAASTAAAIGALPWAAAFFGGAWVSTRAQEDLLAATVQVVVLVLVGVGMFVAARVFPTPILAAAGRSPRQALAAAPRVSRARGGLAVTLVGGLATIVAIALAGAAGARYGLVVTSVAQGIVAAPAFAVWGAWAIEAVLGEGAGAAFSCPHCGGDARVEGDAATCGSCGAHGAWVPAP